MKLQIKTEILKEMVSKSVKGASSNKLIPITQFMCIELKSGVLRLITTDASNYLYIKRDKVEGKDFYVTLEAETFSKLIARMTCENITLEVKDGVLKVTGNGTYNIALPMDENGDSVKFPDPLEGIKAKPLGTINNSTIVSILNTAKPSLAKTLENPYYTGYYFGDWIVATDTEQICGIKTRVLPNDYLINPEMMDLLGVMTAEKVSVDGNDTYLIFTSPECTVYGPIMEGIEEYAIDAITELMESDFPSRCKFSKNSILQLLDRIALFVNPLDEHAVNLVFTKQGLVIRSKSTSGEELIPYTESENFAEFSAVIDIEYLRTQLKALTNEVVDLQYGREDAVKLVEGDVIQIISLLRENVEDE